MTDKDFKLQKKRIKKLIDEWVTPLGLRWWHLDFLYRDYSKQRDDRDITLFDVSVLWEYKQATISCYLPDLVDIKDSDLENHFVHEMCHILVAEMQAPTTPEYIKHVERVVTTMAEAFVWTKRHGYEIAKREFAPKKRKKSHGLRKK